MTKLVGVGFKNAGRSYFFEPGEFNINIGDKVIVETSRGIELGTAKTPVLEYTDEQIGEKQFTPIIRIANESDLNQEAENRNKEREAYLICREKIKNHGLEMKLVQAEYTFERNKLIFYFTADGRVDFRELLKDLASTFHTRIELRQIGVRDETKVLGGIGICGREVCCRTYLRSFGPVSVKMAKEQNLSLNPTKISGICGRLMCCLANEEETYEHLNSTMPRQGATVETPDGKVGTVRNMNILKQKVLVLFEENDVRELKEYDVADLKFKNIRGRNSDKSPKPEVKDVSLEPQEEAPEEAPVFEEKITPDEEKELDVLEEEEEEEIVSDENDTVLDEEEDIEIEETEEIVIEEKATEKKQEWHKSSNNKKDYKGNYKKKTYNGNKGGKQKDYNKKPNNNKNYKGKKNNKNNYKGRPKKDEYKKYPNRVKYGEEDDLYRKFHDNKG